MSTTGQLLRLTGLYWQTPKSGGDKYLQGKVSINGITDVYVKIFKSKIKRSENSPDYSVTLDMGDLVPVSGLWKQEAKSGNTYLQGRVGGFYLKVLPNTNKRGDSDPDYTLNITPILKEEDLDTTKKSDL